VQRRRQGKPEDAAAALTFMVSPVASFLTGQSSQTRCCTDHDLRGRVIERVRAVVVTSDGCLLAIRRDRPGQVLPGVGMSERLRVAGDSRGQGRPARNATAQSGPLRAISAPGHSGHSPFPGEDTDVYDNKPRPMSKKTACRGPPAMMTAFISASSGPHARSIRPCVVTRRIRRSALAA
jgi:hypothetical protein